MTTAAIAAHIPQTLLGPEFGPKPDQAQTESYPNPAPALAPQEELVASVDQSTQPSATGKRGFGSMLRASGVAIASALAVAGPAEAQQAPAPIKPPETPKPHLVYVAKDTPATLTRMVVDRVAPGQTLTPGLFVLDNTGLRLRTDDPQSEVGQFSQEAQSVLDDAGKLAIKGMTPYLPGNPKANNMTVENGVITGVTYDCPSPDKKASLPTIQTLKLQSNGSLSEATFCANNKVDFQMDNPDLSNPKVASGVDKFVNDPVRLPLGGDYEDGISIACSNPGTLSDDYPKLIKSKGGIGIKFNTQVRPYCDEAGVNTIETQGYVKKPGQNSKKVGKPSIKIMGLKEEIDSAYLTQLTKNKITVLNSNNKTEKSIKEEFCRGKNKSKVTFNFVQNVRFTANKNQDFTTNGGYANGKHKIKTPSKKLC